jgi:prepilin-type N-terminal cleavage/methylation domain-containing protein
MMVRSTRRGFSLLEMLVALSITATLLTASLTALDTAFKSYKMTSDSASTHVVTRIVMHRVLSMIRTGKEFGPYPYDVLDPSYNPVTSDFIEFVSHEDTGTGQHQITRLEKRYVDDGNGTYNPELWLVLMEYSNGTLVSTEERPLLRNLLEVWFTLEYDVGPRLRRATVDLTVQPDDLQDANIAAAFDSPSIRLVSSTSPRSLD